MTDCTLREQYIDDVLRRAVTKQLALVFFMERHVVFLQQGSKVLRRVASERRATKVWVLA